MTDNDEKLNALISESLKYPEKLCGVEERLEKRINREKRKKRTLVSSISALAACLLFVILVNTNAAFANVVAEFPVIGKLAEYVKFDKSLSNAIENEYVQEVNLVAWDGNNKLLLPYVIADEKNLVLFFQLPEEFNQGSNQWVNIFLENMNNGVTGEKIEGFSYSTSGLSPEARDENFGFIMQEYHFTEGELPKSIDIEVEVVIENIIASDEPIDLKDYNDEAASFSYDKTGNFKFHIELEDFVEAKIYEINEKHTIMDQEIIVEDMRVYPTGTEVNFSFPDENPAWIKGLELEVLQDGNYLLNGSVRGLSAKHDTENKWMSVYIESNYFEKPKNQELLIKAVRLMDKDEEYITVDIDNKTITPAIEGMELKQVIKNIESATLIFSTQISKDDNHGMFNSKYKDMEGNTYELRGEGTSSYNSQMETIITVKYPPNGKVILQRALTPKIVLDHPVKIIIPK